MRVWVPGDDSHICKCLRNNILNGPPNISNRSSTREPENQKSSYTMYVQRRWTGGIEEGEKYQLTVTKL